jgi:hypothetical protein
LTLLHFFSVFVFPCTALRKNWKTPKPKMTLLNLYTFPEIFEGVFRVFRTFNLESGKISGRFRRFWKKAHFFSALSHHGPHTWGENLNIGHKKRILFRFCILKLWNARNFWKTIQLKLPYSSLVAQGVSSLRFFSCKTLLEIASKKSESFAVLLYRIWK